MKLIDVSRPVFTGMTIWPGDENVIIERTSFISKGDAANISRLHAGVHAGTHIDAPLHFIDDGKSVDKLDINLFAGKVKIIDAQGFESIRYEHVKNINREETDAVFFKTSGSMRTLEEPFDTSFTGLEYEAAAHLAKTGIKVIGTDALSVERYGNKEHAVHKLLLKSEVLIIEGLWFKDITPGIYNYICLPVLIKGSDGAPARVVLFK
ncbi:MAG TPA: cyclase family protein [Clostridia bacterium]